MAPVSFMKRQINTHDIVKATLLQLHLYKLEICILRKEEIKWKNLTTSVIWCCVATIANLQAYKCF